ncbi:MAG: HAD-IC family P-type ATPase [Caldilineaceae bacterium]
MMLEESLKVVLRKIETPAGPSEIAQITAGGVFTHRIPLEPLHVPPAATAEVRQLETPPGLVTRSPVDLNIVHHSGGRIRVRVKALYHNKNLKSRLEQQLALQIGIQRVRANVATRSVLVFFDERIDHERVVLWIGRIAGGEDLAAPTQIEPPGPWHTLEPDEVCQQLTTRSYCGIDTQEAQTRIGLYGANQLPTPRPRSAWELVWEQLNSLPVILLGASALLSLATGGIGEAAAIAAVVALNATIGYVTEGHSERTIAALTKGASLLALVLRNGIESLIPGEQLVPGDVIILRLGMIVPADARLVEVDHLTIDESSLTGESVPVAKQPAALDEERIPLSARTNIVYRGTVVTGGNAHAIVIATGVHTEVGLVQRLIADVRQPETPLQRQMRQLSSQLVLGSLALCGTLLGVGVLRGRPLLEMLRVSVSLMVAAVPEGLPAVANTTLALGLRRLEKQQVLVRRLSVVETLGVVQEVCLDKTGTLTHGRMTLVAAFAGMRRYEIDGTDLRTSDQAADASSAPELVHMLRLASLCSEVEIVSGEKPGDNGLRGSATELALVRAALELGIDVGAYRSGLPVVRMRLRGEKRGFMDTLHTGVNGDQMLAVKGRPAEVLALCDRYLVGDETFTLDGNARDRIKSENDWMAGKALRVLAVAYGSGDGRPEQRRNLVWVGLAGIADPPRDGMTELMQRLQNAGIHTTMITGDQSGTAYAVARQIGLNRLGRIEILDSANLDELDPDVMHTLTQRVAIFARVSPSDKLKIVQAMQRAGRVVAMTGDGVNDGPALRAADVGIAMGDHGSAVAKEVADIVVRDDNLETIIGAVEQGRTIYDDIKKAVHFILASNSSEVMMTSLATVAGLGQPLLPMQLLWINLVTDIFPELALGMEPPEAGVMKRPPRDPRAPMFGSGDVRAIGVEGGVLTAAAMTAYVWGILRYGLGAHAGTLAFSTLTSAQLLHTIGCRSETNSLFDPSPSPRNRLIPLAVGGGLLLQLGTVLLPGLRNLLGVVPLGATDWAVVGATSAAPLYVNEWIKYMRAPARSSRNGSQPEKLTTLASD